MIGFYNYTVYLTYANLISAIFGIGYALNGRPLSAVLCLALAGFFDMFDGVVARTKQRNSFEKRYGVQIDSLADMVSFGLLPAVIGYTIGLNTWYGAALMVLYPLAALIRLAYFNVLTEEDKEFASSGFIGLPVTSSAIVFPAIFVFKRVMGADFKYLYAAIMAVVLVLFVSKIKVKKLSQKGLIALTVIGAIIITVLIICKSKGVL
ncbi:Phosphatidylserine synthase [Alteracholeplasma palmae J233]|uniref:Phosphatidylserine synthase n=1 Tax=Alteracholeplasma palmae (strain ATCC 49389 / J233) TaxID=1318466 RepID=U4KLU8_ALTPJ|nr:CDP-alcohol phosphatidyltransferase family protein [Alteracholeplasma palmae]CCV64984.1 Phosphatidylserine synthase [Alteracholeplasma palmae J233]